MGSSRLNIEEIILYEDKDIIVCKKPGGVPVQTRRTGLMDLESGLKNHLAFRGEDTYLAVIHRLDQPVQGVLVFGKNQKSGASLSEQMKTGQMKKKSRRQRCLKAVPLKPMRKKRKGE